MSEHTPLHTEAGTDSSVPALALSGVSKAFGDVLANDEISLELHSGEIHALLGENGAGKSTLMNIVFGSVAPDAGTMRIEGEEVPWLFPRDAIARGIAMVHQHFMLVPTLTVAENVLLNVMWTERGREMSLREVSSEIAKLGERYGLELSPETNIDGLSVGEKLRLEILKALIQGDLRGGLRVFILDEPTALLTHQEIQRLFGILRELAAQGTAIVIITHKLDEVMEVAKKVTVLRDGRVVGSMETAHTNPGELGTLMVGRELPERRVTHSGSTGDPVLEVADLTVMDDDHALVDGVSFTVHAGEILGVAGVAGNGQDVLAECITALRPASRGAIRLQGQDVTGADRRMLIEREVAHVPEDRRATGLVGTAPVRDNVILGLQRWQVFQSRGWLRRRRINEYGEQLTADYEVRTPGLDQPVEALSGGNQQRVLLGRELYKEARFLLASGPTRGLDIAGTAYVHDRLLDQREQGAAILLVSFDLDELLKLSDRVIVMYRGRLVGELAADDADTATLGLMMGGSSQPEAEATH